MAAAAADEPRRNRIAVMHGVNLDMLGRRDPAHYGSSRSRELEQRIEAFARELELERRCFQTNSEGEFVEHLHQLPAQADGVIVNPGAWTHYSWAIHDALELTGLPAVEVHLSDVDDRDPWRTDLGLRDLCSRASAGQGPEGYRRGACRLCRRRSRMSPRVSRLERLAQELRERDARTPDRQRGREPPLPDRLHRLKRRGRDRRRRPASAPLLHRLPLRDPGGAGGRPAPLERES